MDFQPEVPHHWVKLHLPWRDKFTRLLIEELRAGLQLDVEGVGNRFIDPETAELGDRWIFEEIRLRFALSGCLDVAWSAQEQYDSLRRLGYTIFRKPLESDARPVFNFTFAQGSEGSLTKNIRRLHEFLNAVAAAAERESELVTHTATAEGIVEGI